MAQKHMLPIGEEYFSSIRRGDFYYVDKTGMLSEFFRSRGFVTLFTRPRRFGKSLNMDMFKCFLEIEKRHRQGLHYRRGCRSDDAGI